jgi:tetratricopeptide (TPR) repeat protein
VDEFVVCPSCGTRIKAGREFCLRCFEPLPTPGRPLRLPIWVSLGISRRAQLLLVSAAASIAIGLLVVIWRTRPTVEDDAARPGVAQPARPGPAAAPSAATAQPDAGASEVAENAAPYEPIEFLDVDTGEAAGPPDDFEAARARYEQSLEKKPNDAQALNNLGQALVRLGRFDDAVKRFDKAIALDAGQWAYHYNRARALATLKRWTPAIDAFRSAARLAPQDYALRYDVGLALHKRGDEHDAIAEFQKASALAPNEPLAHVSLGVSLERVNRIPDAVSEYRRFLELQPEAPLSDPVRTHLAALSTGQTSGGRAS